MFEQVQDDVKDIFQGNQGQDQSQGKGNDQQDPELARMKQEHEKLSQIVQGFQQLAQEDPVIRDRLLKHYYGQDQAQNDAGQNDQRKEEPEELTQEELAQKVISVEKKVTDLGSKVQQIDYKEAIEDLARQDPVFFGDEEALLVMQQVLRENPQLEGLKNGAQLAYSESMRRMGGKLQEKRAQHERELVGQKMSGPSLVGPQGGIRSRPTAPSPQSDIRRGLAKMVADHNRSGL